jgi:hypothetical protein
MKLLNALIAIIAESPGSVIATVGCAVALLFLATH